MQPLTRVIASALLFAGAAAMADGVVSSVVKAPITPDGDVAGAPTDFVVDLDRSLDPAVLGRTLAQNCSVRVTLPDAFVRLEPVQDVFTPGCAPGNFQCTTGIFLQGWPQHPILPTFPPPGAPTEYMLTADGDNTLVFTALRDIDAPFLRPAPGPGLKQIHQINGYQNPTRPGHYPIHVEFTDGPGCVPGSGSGDFHIVPKIRPSVHVTSALNGGSNSIYQGAAANGSPQFPWDLLLWNRQGGPMVGVEVAMVNDSQALLRQGDRTVGHVRIDAPDGATGHSVAGGPSVAINAPVKGIPAGLLVVNFTAGSASGRYTSEVSVVGGNSMTFFVDVP